MLEEWEKSESSSQSKFEKYLYYAYRFKSTHLNVYGMFLTDTLSFFKQPYLFCRETFASFTSFWNKYDLSLLYLIINIFFFGQAILGIAIPGIFRMIGDFQIF